MNPKQLEEVIEKHKMIKEMENKLILRLQRWREADHEDALILTRHEIITLLEIIRRK